MIHPVRVYSASGVLKREHSTEELVERERGITLKEERKFFTIDRSHYLNDSYNMFPPRERL